METQWAFVLQNAEPQNIEDLVARIHIHFLWEPPRGTDDFCAERTHCADWFISWKIPI